MKRFNLFGTLASFFLAAFLLAGFGELQAQKFEKTDNIEYLQLPAIGDTYSQAYVFIAYDASKAAGSKELSLGIGKVADKVGGQVGEAMKNAVAEALKPKAEPYKTWNTFPEGFSNGKDILKVVITYTPDDKGRPMGMPGKNKNGEFVVPFRVLAEVKVFDAKNKEIGYYDFGIISGTGVSSEWPAPATSPAGAMPKVEVTEGDEKHPYETVCLEGAIDHAMKVVYGMFGIKKFNEPLGVYTIKDFDDSKDINKRYVETLENKAGLMLNAEETEFMKEFVAYWDGKLSSVSAEEKWAVHHNLAIGYSWLLNDTKAKEHLTALRKEHAPTMKKINDFFTGKAESGTFIKGKEMTQIEIFNQCQPFMEYYAAGINKNPNWPPLFTYPAEEMLYSFLMNAMLAGDLQLPLPLPVLENQQFKGNPKKAITEVYKNDELIANVTYKMAKSKITKKPEWINATIKAVKGKGTAKKVVNFYEIFEDGSAEGKIGEGINSRSYFLLRGMRQHKNLGITPKNLFIGDLITRNAYVGSLPFEPTKELRYWGFRDGALNVNFCEDLATLKDLKVGNGFYLDFTSGDEDWCKGEMNINTTKFNDQKYPEEMSVSWKIWAAKNEASLLKNHIPSAVTTKDGGSLFEKTDKYNLQWTFDDKGNWIELKVDNITIKRTFTY